MFGQGNFNNQFATGLPFPPPPGGGGGLPLPPPPPPPNQTPPLHTGQQPFSALENQPNFQVAPLPPPPSITQHPPRAPPPPPPLHNRPLGAIPVQTANSGQSYAPRGGSFHPPMYSPMFTPHGLPQAMSIPFPRPGTRIPPPPPQMPVVYGAPPVNQNSQQVPSLRSSFGPVTPAQYMPYSHVPAPPQLMPPLPPPPPSSPPPLPPSPPPPSSPWTAARPFCEGESDTASQLDDKGGDSKVENDRVAANADADAFKDGKGPESLPPPYPKPADEEVVKNIEVLSEFIGRLGPQFEDMARIREAGNPKFAFLFGGEPGGSAAAEHAYFQWMKKRRSTSHGSPTEATEGDTLLNDSGNKESSPSLPIKSNSISPAASDMDMDMEEDIYSPQRHSSIDVVEQDDKGELLETADPLYEERLYAPESPIGQSPTRSIPNRMEQQPWVSALRQNQLKGCEAITAGHFMDVSPVRDLTPGIVGNEDRNDKEKPSSTQQGTVDTFNDDVHKFKLLPEYASDDDSDEDCEFSTSHVPAAQMSSENSEAAKHAQDLDSSFQSDVKPSSGYLGVQKHPMTSIGTSGLEPTSLLPIISSHHNSKYSPQEEKKDISGLHHLSIDTDTGHQAPYMKRDNSFVYQDTYRHGKSDLRAKLSRPEEDLVLELDTAPSGRIQSSSDRRQATASQSVDEFGRMIREGVSDSESDEKQYTRRQSRRGRSRSQSRSPQENRKRRRSRSPWRRRDRRSRSRSWSPKKHRSRSPPPRHIRDLGNDKTRRNRGQQPDCFDFLRGKCFRGASCKFLHRDVGVDTPSRRYWGKTPQHNENYHERKTPDELGDNQELSSKHDNLPKEAHVGAFSGEKHPKISVDQDLAGSYPESSSIKDVGSTMKPDNDGDKSLKTFEVAETDCAYAAEASQYDAHDARESHPGLRKHDRDLQVGVYQACEIASCLKLESSGPLPLVSIAASSEPFGGEEKHFLAHAAEVIQNDAHAARDRNHGLAKYDSDLQVGVYQTSETVLPLKQESSGSLPSLAIAAASELSGGEEKNSFADETQVTEYDAHGASDNNQVPLKHDSDLQVGDYQAIGIALRSNPESSGRVPFLAISASSDPFGDEEKKSLGDEKLSQHVNQIEGQMKDFLPSTKLEDDEQHYVDKKELVSTVQEKDSVLCPASQPNQDIASCSVSMQSQVPQPMMTNRFQTQSLPPEVIHSIMTSTEQLQVISRPVESIDPQSVTLMPLTDGKFSGSVQEAPYHSQPFHHPGSHQYQLQAGFQSFQQYPRPAWNVPPPARYSTGPPLRLPIPGQPLQTMVPPQRFESIPQVFARPYLVGKAVLPQLVDNFTYAHLPAEPVGAPAPIRAPFGMQPFSREESRVAVSDTQGFHSPNPLLPGIVSGLHTAPAMRDDIHSARAERHGYQLPGQMFNLPTGITQDPPHSHLIPLQGSQPPPDVKIQLHSLPCESHYSQGLVKDGLNVNASHTVLPFTEQPTLSGGFSHPVENSHVSSANASLRDAGYSEIFRPSIRTRHINPYASTFENPAAFAYGSKGLESEIVLGNRSMPVSNASLAPVILNSFAGQSWPKHVLRPSESSSIPPLIDMRLASADQYDPLFDSIEPTSRDVSGKLEHQQTVVGQRGIDIFMVRPDRNSATLLDVEENTRQKESVATISKPLDNDEFGEAALDAEVGAVENVSPRLDDDDDDDKNWSLGNAAEGGGEIDQVPSGSKKKKKKSKEERAMKLFKIALANYVKDVLKPSWRQGNMSKEAFKTIVKKTVDKVSSAMKSHQIPRSQAKINQYVESSERKLTKLIMGYVDRGVAALGQENLHRQSSLLVQARLAILPDLRMCGFIGFESAKAGEV